MSSSMTAKNSFHWRNNSGELDVFEAARYFSGGNDQIPDKQRPARRSLDMPTMRSNPIPPEYHHIMMLDHRQKQAMKDTNKKCKQPSSPGGRLASFLNSLFSQTHLKKKKKSKSEDESPGGRRKRRSSISHFRITTTATAAAATDSTKSGFRTLPPYANTPTKSYKEFKNDNHQQQDQDQDQHQQEMMKNGRNYKITLLDELHAERINGRDYAWIEEKERISNGVSDKKWEERECRKMREDEDGADSDSSSDLFDLPNHDLDYFSSGLPVYETTHIDRIKINAAATISS